MHRMRAAPGAHRPCRARRSGSACPSRSCSSPRSGRPRGWLPAALGWPGRTGLFRTLHAVPQAEDLEGADPVSPCGRTAEPAGGHRAVGAQPARATMARGIRFPGDGKWQARRHGPQRRRQWRKLPLAMDSVTSEIRARRVHLQPGRRQPRPAGPSGPDPRSRRHRHRDRGRRPRHPPLSLRHHRAQRRCLRASARTDRGDAVAPDQQEWPVLKGGLPGCPGAKRNPARHGPPWPGALEAVDRMPHPQPRRSQAAIPQVFRRAHRRPSPFSLGPMAPQWLTPNRRIAGNCIRLALINRFNDLGNVEIVRVA